MLPFVLAATAKWDAAPEGQKPNARFSSNTPAAMAKGKARAEAKRARLQPAHELVTVGGVMPWSERHIFELIDDFLDSEPSVAVRLGRLDQMLGELETGRG